MKIWTTDFLLVVQSFSSLLALILTLIMNHRRRSSMIRNDVANESGESERIYARDSKAAVRYCATCETVSCSRERTSFPFVSHRPWQVKTESARFIDKRLVHSAVNDRQKSGRTSFERPRKDHGLLVSANVKCTTALPLSCLISAFNGSFHRCRSPSKISFLYSMPRTRSRA